MNKKEEIKDNKIVEETSSVDNEVKETAKNVEETFTSEELIAQEKDKFLRLFAEFENYKKRTLKERIELFKSANQELMTVILPILDDLDRGIVEVKKVKDKDVLKGMELISNKLKNILKQKGLEKITIKSGDTFDAEIHEAITQIPAPSKKMIGKIIDIVEVGYKLGDKIIRYPKVVVGK
ncbi:MAG: nucleotide exchange factor GrpE [Flavobacteriaceae bacterium]|nr:nucleotide exchange factor GrpE [Flavobacteriaceae bacterium]